MLKLGLAFAALAAAGGTTAYLVNQTNADEPAAITAAAPAATGATLPAPSTARPWKEPPRLAAPAAPPADVLVVTDDDEVIDKATIARLKLDRGPSRGPARAPVTIVVFTDFQCDFCGKVLGTIDELWDDYPDQLRLVVKQFPVHKTAVLASEAALAAADQDKFWELHDLMLAHQDDLSKDAILELGGRAGLDVKKLRAALDKRSYKQAVEAEQAAGVEVDVKGTPCFFINGKRFVGARPVDVFRKAIDDALAAAR